MKEEIGAFLAFGLAPVGGLAILLFILNLILAPFRIEEQLNLNHKAQVRGLQAEMAEVKHRLQALEEERIPRIVVRPYGGRRQWDWEHEHLMWAELQVTNTSPSMTLKDVEVRVVSCIYVQPKQDKPNSYVLVNLHDWNPTSIYWSVRDAPPSQLSLSISPNATKTALVAFQDNSNGVQSVFNAPTYPIIVGGAKIEVEISSPNSALWKGSFYIECTPNRFRGPQATFEFVKWEDWEANHDIMPLTPDKEGFLTE